jgi:hypothetical protein
MFTALNSLFAIKISLELYIRIATRRSDKAVDELIAAVAVCISPALSVFFETEELTSVTGDGVGAGVGEPGIVMLTIFESAEQSCETELHACILYS